MFLTNTKLLELDYRSSYIDIKTALTEDVTIVYVSFKNNS